MLTGRQTFQGDTVSEVLASVLKTEADLTLLPARLNPRIPALLRRCLEKNPRRRWYAAGDVRVEIETILADPHEAAVVENQHAARRKRLWRRAVPALVGILLATVIVSAAWWAFRPSPRPSTITRFPFTLGEGQQFANVRPATRRDFTGRHEDGLRGQLSLVPPLDVGARGAAYPGNGSPQSAIVSNPVFSPDGGSIAFWSGADQALKRIAVSGGAAVTICPATNPFGMTWGTDGIVFTQAEGIMRVSANGGLPERLVDATGEGVTNSPQMLPDAQTLLFTLGANTGSPDRWDRARIVVQSLGSGERKTLIEGGSHARYVPTGHLVYALGGVLFAVPFDLKRLEVTAGPVPIVEGVWRAPAANGGSALFSVSDTGSLIYMPGPAAASVGPIGSRAD